MGAHRKPKAKPTTVAVVVTAAIVVPTGTAMAATFTNIGSSAGHGPGLSAAAARNGRANAVATSASQAASGRLGLSPSLSASSSASASALLKGRVPAKQLGSAGPSARKASIPAPRTSPSAAPKTTAAKPSTSAKPTATTKATTAAPKPDPYANLSLSSLEPAGVYGHQQYFTPSRTQWANARTIVAVTKQRGMAPYAAVIAIATAMQESSLINRTSATNYDSLGLFQQRPSMGWGSAAQITDPVYATNAFLAALKTYAPGYQTQSLWAAAQAVQRSGLPTAYAQWQAQAAKMVQAIGNGTA